MTVWDDFRARLRNVELETFKSNPTVTGIPLYDFIIKNFTIEMMKDAIEFDYDLNEPYKGHTKHSYNQCTFQYDNGARSYQTSSLMIRTWHHYHHIKNIENYDRVIEFGAGIGQLARNILSKHDIEYHILDLPEVMRISQYYLDDYNVQFHTRPETIGYKPRTLFISTWGISEVDVAYRNYVLQTICPEALFLIVQRYFEGIDNYEWVNRHLNINEMDETPVKQHPWDGGSTQYNILLS